MRAKVRRGWRGCQLQREGRGILDLKVERREGVGVVTGGLGEGSGVDLGEGRWGEGVGFDEVGEGVGVFFWRRDGGADTTFEFVEAGFEAAVEPGGWR